MGTDFSEASEPALKVAIEKAKATSAELVLFHSLHAQKSRLDLLDKLGISATEPEAVHAERREAAQKRLDAILAEAGVKGRSVIVDDAPADALDALAKEVNASLVVVGTHGHTGLKRMALVSLR